MIENKRSPRFPCKSCSSTDRVYVEPTILHDLTVIFLPFFFFFSYNWSRRRRSIVTVLVKKFVVKFIFFNFSSTKGRIYRRWWCRWWCRWLLRSFRFPIPFEKPINVALSFGRRRWKALGQFSISFSLHAMSLWHREKPNLSSGSRDILSYFSIGILSSTLHPGNRTVSLSIWKER